MRRQALQAPILQARVVGIVHVVDADDLIAARQQRRRHLSPDETGSASQQVARHYSLDTLGSCTPADASALRLSKISDA